MYLSSGKEKPCCNGRRYQIVTRSVIKNSLLFLLEETNHYLWKAYISNVKRKDMEQFKLTPADEMKDKLWGKIGTPERDKMEAQLKEDVHAYFVGVPEISPGGNRKADC